MIPMLAPRSYTREDVIELQCHGSEVCLRRVLRACLDAGARLAEPGGNFDCQHESSFYHCGNALLFLAACCYLIISYFSS